MKKNENSNCQFRENTLALSFNYRISQLTQKNTKRFFWKPNSGTLLIRLVASKKLLNNIQTQAQKREKNYNREPVNNC